MPVTVAGLHDESARMDPATSSFLRYRQAGDLDALGQVFDLLAPRLLSLALHLCRHAADAEDAVQATFVVAMRKAATFDHGQPVGNWLAGILAGEVRNLARRNGRRAADALDDAIGGEASPAATAERHELVAKLRTQIENLPDEQRTALLLQLEHGLQPAEIAELLRVPPGTVRVRVHRGLQALRRLLPPSLASLLLGALAPRGLAAVKTAVLRDAAVLAAGGVGAAAGTTAIGLGGALVGKQGFAAVGVLLIALTAWGAFAAWPKPMPAPASGPQLPAVVATAPAEQDERSPAAAPEVPAPAAAPIQREVAPTTGALRVEVKAEGSGDPIVGVHVLGWSVPAAAVGGPSLLVDACTGDDGTLQVAALPAGPLRVELLPSGQSALGAGDGMRVVVPAGDTVVVSRALPMAPLLRGRTVDERGAIVPGATILLSTNRSLTRRQATGQEQLWRVAGTSGPDGAFAVASVMGEYQVGAHAPRHAAAASQYVTGEALELVLPSTGAVLAGSVRDAAGAAVAGASVGVQAATMRRQRRADGTVTGTYAPMTVVTGSDGTFALPQVELGEHVVTALAPGFAAATQRVTVGPTGAAPLAFVLAKAATLAVTVRDDDGEAVGAARIAVWCGDREAPYPSREDLQTAADGGCVVEALPSGPVRVTATRFGVGRATLDLELRPGEERRCELRLLPRVGIRGQLVDGDGNPVGGRVVTATDEGWKMTMFRDRQQDPFRATSAADGSFDLRDLGPYPFRLQARAGDGSLVLLGEHVEPGPTVRTWVVPARGSAAAVSGRVVGPDGAPRPGARVAAWKQGQVHPRGVLTDAQGRFELAGLDPGTWTVRIDAEGALGVESAPFLLAGDGRHDTGPLQLRAGARLRVRVLDGEGQPWRASPPDVLFVTEDRRVQNGRWRSDETIEFGPLPACRGRLFVHDANLVAWPQDLALADEQVLAAELRVAVGVLRTLRFAATAAPAATVLQVRIADESGRELHVRRVDWPAGQDAVQVGMPLLRGSWHVTAQDEAGRRFDDRLEVRDLTADEVPHAVRAAK